MYKAIIVDDDVAVLSFLSTMIAWEDYGFKLVGSYTNALNALEGCKEYVPDLVVTDIGMPGMDGIQFIQKLKETSSNPQFLILSCHDDFKYAQQAVQLRVHDYILKETLNIEKIKDILIRVHERLKETDLMQQNVEKLKFQALQSKSGLKEQWFRDFLTTPLIDPILWNKQLVDYGVHPGMNCYIPVVCSIHRYHEALLRYKNEDMLKFIVNNAMEELVLKVPNVVYFSYTAKQFCLLFTFRNDLKFDQYDRVEAICKELENAIAAALKIHFSVVVGSIQQQYIDIKEQFLQFLQGTDMFFYSKSPVIIRSTQIQSMGNQEALLAFYSDYLEILNRYILEGNSNVEPVVDQFIDYITEDRFQQIMVKQFIFKLVLDIQMKLTFKHQYNNEKIQTLLDQMGNIDELKAWMITFLQEAVSIMEQISKQSKKAEIIDAQKYVLLHLDQKISLEEVAERLYLNSSYFSRLFKKETGENFTEYVTRMKMEKAKELMLDSNRTIESIAEMLGYDNKGYFVKLYKNHYGVSPRRYK